MASKQNPVVSTSLGKLEGKWNKAGSIASFNGVPYAQAPVGNLRWKAPQPLDGWEGTRSAHKFGNFAWQRRVEMFDFIFALIEGQGWNSFKNFMLKSLLRIVPAPKQNEDCLYLNIKTPNLDSSAKLPVMVWIHGGDHQDGGSAEPFYVGEALSKEGTVYVSINYRLGLMGYFAHPELSAESEQGVSGNYGTLDQIAALQWVKDHIANFGGDPDKVTIFGESAGGESVSHMMTSPLAQGLFHRAIMESPANGGQMTQLKQSFSHYMSSEDQGKHFAQVVGISGPNQVGQLRALPAKQLQKICSSMSEWGSFYPTIDGYVLHDSPLAVFKRGEQAKVPLIIGSNKDEGTLIHFLLPGPVPEYRYEDLRGDKMMACLKTEFQEDVPRLLELYPGVENRAFESEQALLGHVMFGSKARYYAEKAAESGPASYFYHFTRIPPSAKQTAGSFHAAEISFVHGTDSPLLPMDAKDKKLSRSMIKYWTQFAKSGNPNLEGEVQWDTFDASKPQWMELGVEGPEMKDSTMEENYAILNRRMERQMEEIGKLKEKV
ncbi:MAG: carboxylesterase family protein [Bacteroidota bacterium]